jgi:thiol-disulfide isomerase/thioredoxin
MSSWRSWLPTLALALAAASLGLLAGRWWHAPTVPAAAVPGVKVARIGDPVPAIALPDLDGRRRELAEWRGRPLLLNFWASWCAPCVREMPILDRYAANQPANGTQVVGIALDDLAAVKAFLQQTPVRYPTLIEAAGSTDSSVRLGNIRAVLPFSVLIDADGRISRLRTGEFDDAGELLDWATPD